MKLHFDDNTPFNISSLQFEKTAEISAAPFNSINGKTNSNERSLEIFLNQEILTSSIDGSLNKFTVTVTVNEKSISSLNSDSSKLKTII